MTLKDKRIEWKVRYDAWKESGQNIAEWCRDQEIKVHLMYYWVQRFERDKTSSESETSNTQWVTVQAVDEYFSSEGQEPIFIHVDAISVEVRPGANVRLLSDIVQVLKHQ
ncbi:IS66 family insertion sequence element accessory protein TnpA [Virgibacillus natechei]|uniref:IS66 family insertion sequence element accessory protein TnpA n=1 Tax=Virgibacillus sp. CBA3643 TaxID=2942278 RepID=UPI0035A367C1